MHEGFPISTSVPRFAGHADASPAISGSSERPSIPWQPAAVHGVGVGEVEDRRREVEVGDRLVDLLRRRRAAEVGGRDEGQQRDAQRLLVGVGLLLDEPVLAEQQAVVGGEEDRGVVELAEVRKLADEIGDALVDDGERGERAAPAALQQRLLLGAQPAARAGPTAACP